MRLLITDLDNTLYDWVGYYALAFQMLVKTTAETLSLDEEVVLDEFKGVHQRLGDSEYPLAVLELPSVKDRLGDRPPPEVLRELEGPLGAFAQARAEQLRLYPGVADALRRLRLDGVPVVGHTEAIAETAYGRLRDLGVAEHFRHLYALDHGGGPRLDHAAWERPPDGFVSVVPREERKPNPALLLDICAREGVDPADSVYVGDSLTRDVGMARAAGVTAVWARYGTAYDRSLWDVLVRVTHWTDEDVARESRLREQFEGVRPDYVVDRFSDVLDLDAIAAQSAAAGPRNVGPTTGARCGPR